VRPRVAYKQYPPVADKRSPALRPSFHHFTQIGYFIFFSILPDFSPVFPVWCHLPLTLYFYAPLENHPAPFGSLDCLQFHSRLTHYLLPLPPNGKIIGTGPSRDFFLPNRELSILLASFFSFFALRGEDTSPGRCITLRPPRPHTPPPFSSFWLLPFIPESLDHLSPPPSATCILCCPTFSLFPLDGFVPVLLLLGISMMRDLLGVSFLNTPLTAPLCHCSDLFFFPPFFPVPLGSYILSPCIFSSHFFFRPFFLCLPPIHTHFFPQAHGQSHLRRHPTLAF